MARKALRKIINAIPETILSFLVLWVVFWSCAVDSPEEKGAFAMGMVMIGLLIIAAFMAVSWFICGGYKKR